MQYFFTKIRELDLVRARLSVLCTEKPDQVSQMLMFRLLSDVAEVVISDYNGVLEQEEERIEDIFSTSLPSNVSTLAPFMVMYITLRFQTEDDKVLFVEDFIDSLTIS